MPRHASGDFTGPRRAVFDVGGTRFRLVAEPWYDLGRVAVTDTRRKLQ